jgi:peptidoglycan hydrolase CwlO-like protein
VHDKEQQDIEELTENLKTKETILLELNNMLETKENYLRENTQELAKLKQQYHEDKSSHEEHVTYLQAELTLLQVCCYFILITIYLYSFALIMLRNS